MALYIPLVFLILSFGGMALILARKIPALKGAVIQQPANEFIPFVKERIKGISFLQFISVGNLEKILQKWLSKIRIWTIKIEAKIGKWLVSLRQKSIEKNDKFAENYWDKFRGDADKKE